MSSAGLAMPFLTRSRYPRVQKGLTCSSHLRGGDEPLSGLPPPAERPCEQLPRVGCIPADACLQLLVYSYPIKTKF